MRKTSGKRILSVLIVFALLLNISFTVSATGTQQQGTQTTEKKELTEAEKKQQEELETAYKIPTESNSWEGWPKGSGTYGESAIVMEVSTGAILYAKNIDAKQYPASITKVLTALLALENGEFSDKVTFSHDSVAFLQPGDSSVGLKEGNVITLEQALYAMLLASANEAAYAVGENVGQNAGHDYDWFIEQMNTKVKELGGVNSHFANTNGLHDAQHYTCARDMALIGRALFEYPDFFKIVQTLEYKIPASATVEEHVFQQKDKMLQPANENYYKYTIGGKTGFTSDARSTLITMAEKGDMQLVCVVLRTYGKNVYPDTTKLLKESFKNFTRVSVADREKSEDIGRILPDDGGYVILPEGSTFEDLDMEIERDSSISREATLTYTYKGTYVGTARAVLSDAYLDAHTAKVKAEKEADSASKEKTDAGVLQRWRQMGIKERTVFVAACALLAVLILVFVMALVKRKRRRRAKRGRRRNRKTS